MVSAVSLARSPMLDCGRLALVVPTAKPWRHCMADRRSSQRIPPTTVRRLSAYYRALGALVEQGVPHVSSKVLSDLAGSTAPQVRRDLAYFGSFGTRGVGYSVSALRAQLARILGIDRSWPLGLIGVGNLGQALLAYRGFRGPEYTIAAAFDADPAKIGAVVEGVQVVDVSSFASEARRLGLAIALVAVPAEAAQAVVDQVVAADVHAILNFAPAQLRVPAGVRLSNVDLSMEVESLTHALTDGRHGAGVA